MNEQLKDFFYDEIDRRHLDFEKFPEYTELLSQCLALFPGGDLPTEIADLLDTANCISFAYGLKLGLGLNRWAQRSPRKRLSSKLWELFCGITSIWNLK